MENSIKEDERKRKNENEDEPSSQVPKLTNLPPEILTRILNNLSTPDLLRNVALVSKQFGGLTKCSNVSIRAHFKKYSTTILNLQEFLKERFHQIKEVSFCCDNSKHLKELTRQVLSIKKLESFKLEMNFQEEFPKHFLELIIST